jgi:hypothetical protein
MQGDLSLIDRRMGAGAAGKALGDWIRANAALVEPELWRPGVSMGARGDEEAGGTPTRRSAGPAEGLQLYDLKPGAGLVPMTRG